MSARITIYNDTFEVQLIENGVTVQTALFDDANSSINFVESKQVCKIEYDFQD